MTVTEEIDRKHQEDLQRLREVFACWMMTFLQNVLRAILNVLN